MTSPTPERSTPEITAGDAPKHVAPFFRRKILWRLVTVAILFLGLTGSFFVGRRLYYRMIRPESPWTIPTPKTERVVCDDAFTIELWADEMLVHNPTSLSIDARGRVWVSEAVNYRDRDNHLRNSGHAYQDAGDCIVILDDTDHDGRADSRTVFAQDPELVAPTGVCVLGNRVFVSCSPGIYVFTDDDGDDRADRKEIFLTGFGGHDHDHGVHSIVPGPDGRLYFTVGNAGPHVVVDKNGWTLRSGSHYQSGVPGENAAADSEQATMTLNAGGLVSDDGNVYVGGLVLSIESDGSGLRVHSHNARNPYEACVDSFGDVWQTDNDDTASCRMTWLMNGANTGFASADGNRSWQADQRPGQPLSRAHWHQDDPGVVPDGDVYGTGAPTGLTVSESRSLGDSLQGAILACDAGLGCVFAYHPVADGAGFGFRRSKLIWSEALADGESERPDGLALTWFRPSDIAFGPEGQLFVADWYDSYVGGHRVTDERGDGRIYIVRPVHQSASFAHANGNHQGSPEANAEVSGAIAAIQSDVAEIRWEAHHKLVELGSASVPALQPLLSSADLFVHSRAVWVLSQLGEEGKHVVRAQLTNDESQIRIAAFRALLAAGESPLSLATLLVNDPSPAVRREIATALRGQPLDDSRTHVIQLAVQVDGLDRSAVEAFGLACEGHEESLYPELRLRQSADPEAWSANFATLVWRLHPSSALTDLRGRLELRSLQPAEVKRTMDAVAFVGNNDAKRVLESWVSSASSASADKNSSADEIAELREYAEWWLLRLTETHEEMLPTSSATSAGLSARFAPAAPITVDQTMIERIDKISGDAARGQELFHSKKGTCGTCHRVGDRGGVIGPELTHISRKLGRNQLIESILYPGNSILTGYETWTIADTQGRTFSGLLQSVGSEVVLRSAEGIRIATPLTEIEDFVRQGTSIMPETLGKALTEQELADVVEFLMQVGLPKS